MAIEVYAPAKVNLALHVTGLRADGYHLLDSIVVFADIGDVICVCESDRLHLDITGPEAGGLGDKNDNLVLRAARLFAPDCTARIALTKNLPVASGIGGGSSDAAATLRALAQLYGKPLPATAETTGLGADVPACLSGRPVRMRGVGDYLSELPDVPALDIVLVNPRVAVSTAQVFAGLGSRNNPPMPETLPRWPDPHALCSWLHGTRNDLLAPARALVPQIDTVLGSLRETDCLFAGMSGSGATCFGLYLPDGRAAHAACAEISRKFPEWWCRCGVVKAVN